MLRRVFFVDSPLLAVIHGRCFDDGWNAESFENMLSQDIFFGFLNQEKTVQGFILGKMLCCELEIITFCVLPEFRNRGVGKKLIGEIEAHAQNHCVKKVFLEVSEDNPTTRKIYENSGYVEISRRFKYYHTKNGNFDAVVMQKTFNLF
jgi:ribosomal-protein-alanine acetyltransferase